MEWAGLTTHYELNRYEGALVTAKPRACNIKAAAAASIIKVSVVAEQEASDLARILIRVQDDALGIDVNLSESRRFGLLGMRERVQAFNGDIKIDSSRGSGTLITADMTVFLKGKHES